MVTSYVCVTSEVSLVIILLSSLLLLLLLLLLSLLLRDKLLHYINLVISGTAGLLPTSLKISDASETCSNRLRYGINR